MEILKERLKVYSNLNEQISRAKASAKAKELIAKAKRFDASLDAEVLKQLKELRKNLIFEVTTAKRFTPEYLEKLKKSLEEQIREFETRLKSYTAASQNTAWNNGQELADGPLKAAGLVFDVPRLSTELLILNQDYTADLITGLRDETINQINGVLNRGMLAGKDAYTVGREIDSEVLGVKEERGISYKAEKIVRTENNRVYNMSEQGRIEQIAGVIPGLKKEWAAVIDNRTRPSHLAAHGQIVDWDADFEVGGHSCSYPNDPSLPPEEVVNCRCRMIPIPPEE